MKNPRSSILRGALAAFAFVLAISSAQAGDIVGRVLDSERGGYLPGATVILSGSGRQTSTDSDGRFKFSNVPAGEVTIQTTYLGYSDVVNTVTVPQTGAVPVEITLSESVLKLEAFQVEGQREGRSKALQQKKAAGNIMDIISADSAGNLPDRNVAEALSRVAGISVDFNSGEGQFVSIRGIEPNLNNVTFNGSSVAPPGVNGRSGRATQLDIIAASQISSIEVVKSVTPDMDGVALGGSINIKTVSGFDRKDRFIFGAFEAGYNGDNKDDVIGGDFTFGDTFDFGGDRKLGVALAASYSRRHALNDETQFDWIERKEKDADGNDVGTGEFFISNFELHPENALRERLGLNLNLEYQPDTTGTNFYLRAIYNEFNTNKNTDELRLETRRDPPTAFLSPTVVGFNRMRFEVRKFREQPRQRLVNLSPGFVKKFGNNTLEAELTYSWSRERLKTNDSVQFRTNNINVPSLFEIDFTNFHPTFDDKGSITAPTTVFPLRRFRVETSLVKEETWTPRIDFKHDFDNLPGGLTGFIKVGGKYTERDRLVDDNSIRPVNTSLTIDSIPGARGGAVPLQDGKFVQPISINFRESFDFLNANPGLFTINEAESQSNSSEDDFDVGEEIQAYYGMVSVNVTPKLTVMSGMRYEHTSATVVGLQARTVNGEFLGIFPKTGSTKYDDYLGNAQFRFEVSKNLIFRGAWTRTLGRPAYEDFAPISNLTADPAVPDPEDPPIDPDFSNDGTLEIGNPELKPFRSRNFDLSLEYFLKSGGILSVGAFHKQIKNPIFEFRDIQQNVVNEGIGFNKLDVTQTRNADRGKVKGLEFNAQIPFSTFLGTGTFVDGFGVEGNATFIDSSVQIEGRENLNIGFFRQPDEIYNVAIYYQYGRINARVAYNYQTAAIRELGDDAAKVGDPQRGTEDIFQDARGFYDAQVSYKVTENFTIYAVGKNLSNTPNEEYIGDKSRIRRSQLFGADIRFGVRFNF